ncbi:MAG: hypothetical protein M3N18_13880 [Actinomycetota bacterium]|nr:hypothetical protein [Actinomycetota bacterium]
MRCCKCGAEAPALKTCRRRDGDGRGVLCDPCWLPLRDRVWVIPGPHVCFGKCSGCGEWFSLRELPDRRPGGKWSAPTGTCVDCAG